MARLITLRIPFQAARDANPGMPLPLMSDERQVIKNALAVAFGERGVRPWRLVGEDGESYEVAGWLDARLDDRRLAEGAARIAATYAVRAFEPVPGETVMLDIQASPQRSCSRHDGKDGKRRNQSFDAATGKPSARAAYVDWLDERVHAPRTGLSLRGDFAIRSTRAGQGIYRNEGGYVSTRVPQVEARVQAEVKDPALFEAYLLQGVGPLTFAGYGCIIPEGLLDAA